MMKKAFYICLTLIYSISLSSQDRVKNILKKQLSLGVYKYIYGTEVQITEYDEEDMIACAKLNANILKSNGYKTPSNSDFINKIKTIFHRKIDITSNTFFIYSNFYNICSRQLAYYINNRINYYGIYVVKNENFITDLYRIPEIIDYKKEFPKIISFENNIPTIQQDKDYDEISIALWKDIEDLPEQRRFNKQLLISRNKYLFNEDQSQFPWLITHDEFFMESLVKTFGYTEDERLLEWVVNRTLNSTEDEEYNKIFFTKDCRGNFILHKNTFSLIQKKISEKYLESLIYNYLKKIDANKDLQILNFEQKAEVLAYILYTGEAAAQKKFPRFLFRFMGPFYEFNKEREQYNQEFKRKNYYNLPNFKEYWEQAMIDGDGIGIPM